MAAIFKFSLQNLSPLPTRLKVKSNDLADFTKQKLLSLRPQT